MITHEQLQQLRSDTSATQHIIHFNNAGAALSPAIVNDTIKAYLDLENEIGGYEAEALSAHAISEFYTHAAALINADKSEIAFIDNATRAWDMAFYSLNFNKGDKILTANAEYASNYLAFLHVAKRTGVAIDVIPDDEHGQLDVVALQNQIDSNVKLIAITHVPTNGGLVNPAEKVGEIAKQYHIPYLLDATQSVGQMPIDVKKLHCDFLCATGRKYLRGPRGTGFLYVKKERIAELNPPFIDLHSATWVDDDRYVLKNDAARFETWERNIAGQLGLSAAISYANHWGVPAIWQRIQLLATHLRQSLSKIPAVQLHDLGVTQCGIVTFSVKGFSAQAIKEKLNKSKINVSISLQEYARLDMARRDLSAIVRASLHCYNTEDEIERFSHVLKR